MREQTNGLVDIEELRRRVWHPKCRPGLRTLKRWQKQKLLPCIRLGGRVFFDVEEVRAALVKKAA
jgi:hypothetical protein